MISSRIKLTKEHRDFLIMVKQSGRLDTQHDRNQFFNWNISFDIQHKDMIGNSWAGYRIKDWINIILERGDYTTFSDRPLLNSVRTFYINYKEIVKINGNTKII